jgi:hypothetical protein
MCQVCKVEGVDWKFRNGPERPLQRCVFYRVYQAETKMVHLCLLCSVELFHIGESRFLSKHPLMAFEFSRIKNRATVDEDDFDFSFA